MPSGLSRNPLKNLRRKSADAVTALDIQATDQATTGQSSFKVIDRLEKIDSKNRASVFQNGRSPISPMNHSFNRSVGDLIYSTNR